MTSDRKLCVFPSTSLRAGLCQSAPKGYASQDKSVAPFGDDIRELYQRLNDAGWIDPWLDEEKKFYGKN